MRSLFVSKKFGKKFFDDAYFSGPKNFPEKFFCKAYFRGSLFETDFLGKNIFDKLSGLYSKKPPGSPGGGGSAPG